jgi:hypothetical protein
LSLITRLPCLAGRQAPGRHMQPQWLGQQPDCLLLDVGRERPKRWRPVWRMELRGRTRSDRPMPLDEFEVENRSAPRNFGQSLRGRTQQRKPRANRREVERSSRRPDAQTTNCCWASATAADPAQSPECRQSDLRPLTQRCALSVAVRRPTVAGARLAVLSNTPGVTGTGLRAPVTYEQ